jgi:hypothetical protein
MNSLFLKQIVCILKNIIEFSILEDEDEMLSEQKKLFSTFSSSKSEQTLSLSIINSPYKFYYKDNLKQGFI